MESLFNPHGKQNIIDRINQLQPTSLSQWGKMTVNQMLEHCQAPLKLALGDLKIKRTFIGILIGKLAKKTLVNDKPFDHNLPTAKEFRITDEPEFEKTKDELIGFVNRFGQGPSSINDLKHPFFGTMTSEEWDIAQWKHLDHHLRQFGV